MFDVFNKGVKTIHSLLRLSGAMGHTANSHPSICFYIHHHGAGHVMRAISIAGTVQDYPVCFMGSNLKPYAAMISPQIECIHLPMDVPVSTDPVLPEGQPDFLHYSPLGIEGIRERAALMSNVFISRFPMVLIVDVSVEVTMLARLCGIPTIVMLQHGLRNDTAHINAYLSAELLIAPYSASMASAENLERFAGKTCYSGGFSRYSDVDRNDLAKELPGHVAILLGKGGTSIDASFILFLAAHCEQYIFHVVGDEQGELAKNIIWHGQVEDPLDVLCNCEVVIGNAGHNTVMEMADLNKRFICIPEERPFEEQQQKAAMLAANGNALVVKASDLYLQKWPGLLDTLCNTAPNWKGVMQKDALQRIGTAIKTTAEQLYSS